LLRTNDVMCDPPPVTPTIQIPHHSIVILSQSHRMGSLEATFCPTSAVPVLCVVPVCGKAVSLCVLLLSTVPQHVPLLLLAGTWWCSTVPHSPAPSPLPSDSCSVCCAHRVLWPSLAFAPGLLSGCGLDPTFLGFRPPPLSRVLAAIWPCGQPWQKPIRSGIRIPPEAAFFVHCALPVLCRIRCSEPLSVVNCHSLLVMGG
jgi:hypothetical protein